MKKPERTPQDKFSIHSIREQFPFFSRGSAGIYLDSAATTQKPQAVIDRISDFYTTKNANVHRSSHFLGEAATTSFEEARETLRLFLGATYREEIIWTRGTTESINLVAQSYGPNVLKPGDQILIGLNSHHSNIVPWQLLAQKTGAVLKPVPLNKLGEVDILVLEQLLASPTKIIAVSHVANADGIVNPVNQITELAHRNGASVLIDGAQAVAHFPVDVAELDCDFYAFSGHKVFGPMGIGVLYGKRNLLENMPPWQAGGEMIKRVSFKKTSYQDLPYKFEAGTPAVAEALGLETSIRFLSRYNWNTWQERERELAQYARHALSKVDGMEWVRPGQLRIPILSFNLARIHCLDLACLLDRSSIAVRAGTHCCMPFYDSLGLKGSVRVSLSIYNQEEEIDQLVAAVEKARQIF